MASENFHQKPRSSKYNKIPETFDLPDTDNVYDSPTSFADKSNSFCILTSHIFPLEIFEPKKVHDHNREKNFVFSFHRLPLRIINIVRET